MPNTTLGSFYRNRPPRQTLTAHPLVNGLNRVGVEIELENIGNVRFHSDYWEVKGDGSLRNNGREFVFRGPTGGVDLFNAIVELDGFLFDKNPDGNWRCSTHVHVDVRDMNIRQLKNLILTYMMYEKVLFRLSGMHRYNNNFCCAIGFAQQQLQLLSEAWSRNNVGNFMDKILRGWDKYSALNLLPISGFGSVEFRLSEPVWRKGKLLLLCNRYLALKEFAMSWEGSELELINYLIKADPREVLGKGCPKELPKEVYDDLEVGIKLCHDLVTFSEDRIIPVFPAPHPRAMIQIYWRTGNPPGPGHERINPELFMDGSPACPQLAPNIRRFLRDRCIDHGLFLPEQLSRTLTYTAVSFFCDLFRVDADALMDQETVVNYWEWINADRPLQALPDENLQPPQPEPVLFEDDGLAVEDEDHDDEDDVEW